MLHRGESHHGVKLRQRPIQIHFSDHIRGHGLYGRVLALYGHVVEGGDLGHAGHDQQGLQPRPLGADHEDMLA